MWLDRVCRHHHQVGIRQASRCVSAVKILVPLAIGIPDVAAPAWIINSAMINHACSGRVLLKRMATRERRLLVFWQNGGGPIAPPHPSLAQLSQNYP
ncbi:MAG: hypothetical protein HKL95_06600 [Phycisphaerae bacterium]|nr:hypothetical protein [Phycisphaerae bacterium]